MDAATTFMCQQKANQFNMLELIQSTEEKESPSIPDA